MKKSICFVATAILVLSLLVPAPFTVGAASTDVLQGKTVLVVGDDISRGRIDSNKQQGWSSRLEDTYGMVATPMHSSSGVTLSDWRENSSGRIIAQIPTIGSNTYDYILLHGGMADAEKGDTGDVGVVTGAVGLYDYTIPEVPQDMEARTFAAGMERLIQAAIKKYNGKRIGFIINYATPNNSCENARDMSKYWNIARQVCDKWNIPYLDLYDGKTADGKSYSYDILDMDDPKSSNHNNNKHLKAAGYDAITPYIAQWMTTIQPYDLDATLATAPTTTTTKRSTTTTTTTTTGGGTASKTEAIKTDSADSTEADPTKTTAEGTKNTSSKEGTTTSTLSETNGQERAPENSAPAEDTDGDRGGGNALPIVLTTVTAAAALAVLVVLAFVIYKRYKA